MHDLSGEVLFSIDFRCLGVLRCTSADVPPVQLLLVKNLIGQFFTLFHAAVTQEFSPMESIKYLSV